MTTRRFLLSVLLLSALSLGVSACTKSADLKALTVDQVAARIAAHDGHTYIYDNNPQDGFANGHVPGAQWLDYDSVKAADLPLDKSATLIFYCASEL